MKKLIMASLLTLLSTSALADSVIMTKTQSLKSIPITVNTEKRIYTVEGPGPLPEGDFFYTYPGFRCVKEQTNIVGVKAAVFHAEVPGQSDIYCYPE